MLIGYKVKENDEVVYGANGVGNLDYAEWYAGWADTLLELDKDETDGLGSPSLVKYVGGDIIKKTEEELYNESLPQREDELYQSCYAYQKSNIDDNLDRIMQDANLIVKTTDAVIEDFPNNKANGDWLNALWTDYYARKDALLAMLEYDCDFSNNGDVPHSYTECASEIA